MDIWQIKNELGLKKYNETYLKDGDGYGYKGVVSTGDFTCIGDYGIGLLQIDIKNHLKYSMVVITTIDDGVWQGYGNKNIDVDKIAKEFDENFGVKLPTEKELNDFLSDYGIFGQYTG